MKEYLSVFILCASVLSGWAAPDRMMVSVFTNGVLTTSVNATNTLTLTDLPHVNDTTIAGGVTYTWKASVTTTANEVKIGVHTNECITNLVQAINAGTGGGAVYGSSTVVNPDVSALQGTDAATNTMSITVMIPGTYGQTVSAGGSMNHGSWTGAKCAGGVDGTFFQKNSNVLARVVSNMAAPASPNEGESWQDSTYKARSVYQSGMTHIIPAVMFISGTGATVTNTVAETSIVPAGAVGRGTNYYPANYFTANKLVRVQARVLVTGASANATVKLKIGAFTLTSGLIGMGTLVASPITVDGWFRCATQGAGGTGTATMHIGSGSWTYTAASWNTVNVTDSAFNTTSAGLIDMTIQPAATTQSFKLISLIIETLN